MQDRSPRKTFCQSLFALVLFCLAPVQLLAETPTLTRLFPAGALRGQTTQVEVKGKYNSDQVRIWSNRPDLEWQFTADSNMFDVTIAEAAEPGVAYVRIVDDGGASQVHPFVIGHLAELSEQEPNNELHQANPIEQTPLVINGVLQDRADVDNFHISMRRGETLVASVVAESVLQSPVDATLQIVSPAGNVLAQNLDYHGLDPQIVWTAKADGDVVVRVFGFPATPNSTIALAGNENYLYRLTLTTGPFIEAVMPLAVSDSQVTSLQPVGWNLTLEDGSSLIATRTVEPVADSANFAFFQPDIPGLFELPVVAAPIVVLGEPANQPGKVTQVTIPTVVSGMMQTQNQRDSVQFHAVKGTKWVMQVDSRSLGYPLDPVLEIEDVATGNRLAREDDTNKKPDPLVRWTVPADGQYRVHLSDLNGIGGENFAYRLSIFPEASDFAVSVSADRFEGKVGEVLEIPVQIERIAGFADPLELLLEETPAGVSIETAVSEPQGDSAKQVKLTLNASAPVSQPIRILARTKQQADLTKFARETTHGQADLWVTFK